MARRCPSAGCVGRCRRRRGKNAPLLLYRNSYDMINDFVENPYLGDTTPFRQCRDTQCDHGQLYLFGYYNRIVIFMFILLIRDSRCWILVGGMVE